MENNRQPEFPSTPETTIDIEEADVRMASEKSVEDIDASLKKAQESLQHRQKAQRLRERSQAVFAQSESIMEEAIRSVEAAGKAFAGDSDADSTVDTEAAVKAQGMAETLRSRLKKNRSAYQDVLRQALGPKELATQDLAAALDSLNLELINVEQELEESAIASPMADSAKESAIQELLSVHTLWNGFASQAQEPLAQPDSRDAGPKAPLMEPTNGFSVPDSEHGDDHQDSNLQLSTGESASETLHRKLAGLMAMPEDAGTKVQNGKSNGAKQPTPASAVPDLKRNSPARPVVSNAGLAQTYTGRVYLMFDALLSREDLEVVWDAVEEAAGPGVIVDTRLVSQNDGVQVTLDLGETTLEVAAFRRRLRGAELAPIADDRLKVVWTAAVSRN